MFSRAGSPPAFRPRAAALVAVAVLIIAGPTPAQPDAAKRPLKHTDYDGWKSIQAPVLSRDGKYLAYLLIPQEGDGQFVVRNVTTGAEYRFPRGRVLASVGGGDATPGPTAPPTRFGRPPTGGGLTGGSTGGTHQFTPDVKAVVFSLVPPKAEFDKARQEKKKADEMPRAAVVVVDLATGQVTARLERVSGFTVGGEGAGLLIGKRETRSDEKSASPPEKGPAPGTTPPEGTPAAGRPPARTYGSDLVIRNLADGSERVLNDVTEYSLTRDGKALVYAVSSRKEESNGVYVLAPPTATVPTAILSGKGRYQRLTWDEKQTQLVFLSDKEDAAAAKPAFKVYGWDRSSLTQLVTADPKAAADPKPAASAATATDLLGPKPDGLRPGWVISDRAGFSFSPDGSRLYLSTGPAPAPAPAAGAPPAPTPPSGRRLGGGTTNPAADDKVVVDLWHWKDEYIQPMQRVRAAADQNRTYRAVYFFKDKTFRQLSDETLDVSPALEGDWAIGADNRKYRHLTGYGPDLSDYALVHVRTGEHKPLLEASRWPVTFSPKGRYLLTFDGKDWHALSVPDGKKTNLTGKLPVKFAVEDWDTPSEAPAYGATGWTTDEKYVLLNDRYDIWKVAVDGSEAKPLTGGLGRKTRTVLRLVRLGTADPEQRERGVDLTKPLLLKADNQYTRDEGFYRLEPGADVPQLLILGARSYGLPVKAKDADVYLLTVFTFYDAPDYFVTGPDFREFCKVTDANPQKKDLVWGKAELVRYKNLDGVELSGVLIKPENFDPHQKYPLLVYIYERLSQNLHRFVAPAAGTSINASYYASNGYLVFMPDIVYKVGSPGQSALQCVLPGIQAVVDKGFVNEKAIGIQGHSWGGYQIAYMITQTNRFKAAAAGAPVSDMVSAYGGIRWGSGLPRQFQYERTQSRIGGTLWEKPTRFIENSPIFMADRVQTPLLMLHNDQDDAVPWYQGIEYFLALRRLGKECYLFNYNGEPHGLRKKANQRDYTMRLQQFFDHHLKGAPKPEWMEKGIPYLEREKEKEQWKEVVGGAKN